MFMIIKNSTRKIAVSASFVYLESTRKEKKCSDNKLIMKPALIEKESTLSARLRAVAPSAPIGLLLRYNSVNVLFWLQIRNKHTLIMPIIKNKSMKQFRKISGGVIVTYIKASARAVIPLSLIKPSLY